MSVSDHLWRYRFIVRMHDTYRPDRRSRPILYRGSHRRPWRPFGALSGLVAASAPRDSQGKYRSAGEQR